MIPSYANSKQVGGGEDDFTLYQHTKVPRTVSIIGAPMTYGQPYVGTDITPELLRRNGLRNKLSQLDWRVEEIPDLDFDGSIQSYVKQQPSPTSDQRKNDTSSAFQGIAKNHIQVGSGCHLLADTVYQKLQTGRFPLILGGDHSIGVGSIAGILKHRPDTGIIWIDAHADLNIPALSESGNMHGMPLGLMMDGLQKDNIPGFEWLYEKDSDFPNRIQPNSLVYVGLRDVDYAERKLINELGILAYTMTDIDHYGIGRIMDMTFQYLFAQDPNRPIHISYDIDAVDPKIAPATGTAVRGGLTFREAHYVAEAIAQTGNLASAEIVELNPSLSTEDDDGADDTIELGLQLLTSLMGKSII